MNVQRCRRNGSPTLTPHAPARPSAAGFASTLEAPLLSCNVNASRDANLAGKVKPYTIKTLPVSGKKVAIIGLTTPDTAVISSPGGQGWGAVGAAGPGGQAVLWKHMHGGRWQQRRARFGGRPPVLHAVPARPLLQPAVLHAASARPLLQLAEQQPAENASARPLLQPAEHASARPHSQAQPSTS